MAYVSTSRQTTITFGDRIVALFKVAGQTMHRRRIYLETLNELTRLNDRDLADLGLERDELPTVARQAAYGV